jgi:transposase InsO family protein
MKSEHSVRLLCQTLEVSLSGYYDWCRRPNNPPKRVEEDLALRQEIKAVHRASRQTYGAPRIQYELRCQGRRHGRNRIARLMREQGICGRQKPRFRPATTDSNHDQPIAPNHLATQPVPTGPNQIWVGDITYIRTVEGWLYLAAILDLYSRRIVGWATSRQVDTSLVLQAWEMAVQRRRPSAGLIFHSDRGVQYASADFRQALAAQGAVASMSRKANCYDNAFMESFWSTLKLELIYRRDLGRFECVHRSLFEYVEGFYNQRRRHSSLGYQTPAALEAALN